MDIWLVSPAWRRYGVTRLALAERRWLCDQLAARGWTANSVIVADDDNLDLAAEYGFPTVEADNSDLGRRFNLGYQYAAEQGADIFVHVGSDDWIHPATFDVLTHLDLESVEDPPWPEPGHTVVWRRGPQCISHKHISLVELETGMLRRCHVRAYYGCIPWLIPRGALDPSGFRPIPEVGLKRGIDGELVRGLDPRPTWTFQDPGEDFCVDFKTDTNITAYQGLSEHLGYGDPLDAWQTLSRLYPPDLVSLARQTAEAL